MEKVFTSAEHVAWLREQARLERPYWYGTYYNPCTEALLQKKAKQYPSHYTSKRMPTYRKHINAGQICGDCVNGAIKGAIWSELGKRKPVYASHNCPDRSADGMFSYCKSLGMDWGTIDTMPDKPGLAVRMAGHVGVYVGNGEVVEWRGFAYGCVITKLKERKWLHWYELPWSRYAPAEDTGVVLTSLGSRLLKRGKTGDDVKILQELLMQLGYKLPKYGADGEYGAETENAVRTFQRVNGLEMDGKYGPLTHAELMADIAEAEDDDEPEAAKVTLTVTGGSVYVRKGASTAHDIITVVHKGNTFDCIATAENGWHCIEINGGTGWISGKYTTKN